VSIQLLVDEWMSGTTIIIDTTIGKSETWGWDRGALSNGNWQWDIHSHHSWALYCILEEHKDRSWSYPCGVVFSTFPSLSKIVRKGKDGTEELRKGWRKVCISLAKAGGEDALT